MYPCVHGSSKGSRTEIEESVLLFQVLLIAAAVLVAHICNRLNRIRPC